MATRTRPRYTPRMPREERRDQVLDAALRLLDERGFGAMSMEGVAREADIAKTVVYDLFENRQGLLRMLFEREQERALADIAAAVPSLPLEGDPRDVLVASLTTVLEAVHGHPETWRLILLPADGAPPALRAAVERHRERLIAQLEPLIEWALPQAGLPALDPELTANTILALFENAIRLTLTRPRRFSPDRIAAFAGELMSALGAS